MLSVENLEKWPIVSEYAKQFDVPIWRVREAIMLGELKVDKSKHPMRITGGVMLCATTRAMRRLEAEGQRNWVAELQETP